MQVLRSVSPIHSKNPLPYQNSVLILEVHIRPLQDYLSTQQRVRLHRVRAPQELTPFFLTDPPPPDMSPLSLHDALPTLLCRPQPLHMQVLRSVSPMQPLNQLP